LYAWGKSQDEINQEVPGPSAHQTSEKTRRLILKLLADNIDSSLLNENLKTLGFSVGYWENEFRIPVPVGNYMDSSTCLNEQGFLRDYFKGGGWGSNYYLKVQQLFLNRY